MNSELEFELNGQMVSFARQVSNPELMAVVATLAKRCYLINIIYVDLKLRFLAPGLKLADEHAQRQKS
jgi:hypothetical protein